MNNIQLRDWQKEALAKAINWLVIGRKDRHFLINAAPGAGKTVTACVIAAELIKRNEIDRVIVIAPRVEVVNQWSHEFKQITGRFMSKVTGADGEVSNLDTDICATWAAIQSLQDNLDRLCQKSKTLVICDEHHHAAVEASWGESAGSAFNSAKFSVILTGTPIRSDGEKSIWLAYDSEGAINHPEGGTYTLTYGNAVELGYCRPATFHRHEGKFNVDLDGGKSITVTGKSEPELEGELKRIPGLQRALNFYRLACTPQYMKDQKTPSMDGYQASMLEWGIRKLDETRERLPEAGGLVIAPNIQVAEYMAELLEKLDGEAPMLVHSKLPNPEAKINAFRNTRKRWLVSVAMVSEGVDIRRLRVLVYLPNALTELSFRQAVGRVIRAHSYDDDSRAYVVMPSFETFNQYARRVEKEMPINQRGANNAPSATKKCPSCRSECSRTATICDVCGHEFEKREIINHKICHNCGTENSCDAKTCIKCGKALTQDFFVTLDEALRDGVITKGMDISEEEVLDSEVMARRIRSSILETGDPNLIKLLRAIPEESYARLRKIMDA